MEEISQVVSTHFAVCMQLVDDGHLLKAPVQIAPGTDCQLFNADWMGPGKDVTFCAGKVIDESFCFHLSSAFISQLSPTILQRDRK